MTISIGADPEVFVSFLGKLVSGFNLIPGTKEKPHKVPRGAVQVDGMALEFNIDPAYSEEEFVGSVDTVLSQMAAMVPDHCLVAEPVAHFGKEYIDEQPQEAKELGCDPDFNAYEGGAENPTPDESKPFRTAAGHVHIGWDDCADQDDMHSLKCRALAKELDLYLGLGSLLFDADGLRRELYGKAGAFRPKSYGMEYRTLSNKWLSNTELTAWVYRNAYKAVDQLFNGNQLANKYGDELATIINTSDVKRAKEIILAENLEMPNVLD